MTPPNPYIGKYYKELEPGEMYPVFFECTWCKELTSTGHLYRVDRGLFRFECDKCKTDPTRTVVNDA